MERSCSSALFVSAKTGPHDSSAAPRNIPSLFMLGSMFGLFIIRRLTRIDADFFGHNPAIAGSPFVSALGARVAPAFSCGVGQTIAFPNRVWERGKLLGG